MSVQFGDYGDRPRSDMLHFLPAGARRILDVGCLAGGFGEVLKAARPGTVVWGIDPNPDAVAQARTRLDHAICGMFPDDLVGLGDFDCVVFNDVLEHMADPWTALDSARHILAPGGCVVASIPNVRHFTVVVPLVFHGRWAYRDFGILDRTHLRFFTRAQVQELFEGTGYTVDRFERIRVTPAATARWARMLHLAGRWGADFLNENFAVVARPAR